MILVPSFLCVLLIQSPGTQQPEAHRQEPASGKTSQLSPVSDTSVQAALENGEAYLIKGEMSRALQEFKEVIQIDPKDSLAHYRIASIYFGRGNYDLALNSYRDALAGDDQPYWVEAWSHIQLGKIFDIRGQRERAVCEYRLAIQAGELAHGAIDQAQKLLDHPFQQP